MLKRLLRRLLIISAGVVVLVVLFYAEENWRGKHAWEKYRREREAKGDHFEWSAIVPPPVPDDQNFAMTPLFAELFPKRPGHPRLEVIKLPDCPTAAGNWREGRTENLAAWRTCFTNDDLLAALSQYDPVLHEIEEASRRPYARFPIRYQDSFAALLPHLSPLRNLARVYRLRALAELAADQTEAALEDVQANLRLAGRLKDEPVLISFLVQVAIIELTTQPVWEGLTPHRWNESQLSVLQAQFENIDQFESFAKALQGERLFAYHTIHRAREHPSELARWFVLYDSPDAKTGLAGWLCWALPSGLFYQNQLSVDRFYTQTYLPAVDWGHRRISPQAIRQVDHSFETMRTTPYTVLCRLLAAAETSAAKKMARSQAAVDEAAVACALERYRLAHGEFPEDLDALVPQFISKLPHDVINGQPLGYHRTAADQFVLYSIGWNERDDGGQIVFSGFGDSQRQDFDKGDWVWFSQPQPSASERK
jgi:hypothetical protein